MKLPKMEPLTRSFVTGLTIGGLVAMSFTSADKGHVLMLMICVAMLALVSDLFKES